MTEAQPSISAAPARYGRVAAACVGLVLVVCACAATERWFDRHFLPSFFLPRRMYLVILTVVRVTLAGLGLWLTYVGAFRQRRGSVRRSGRMLSVVIAGLLALGASEVSLRFIHLRPGEWLLPEEEPRRQADPRLGWTLVPSRVGRAAVGGRSIEYAVDAAGYRVRSVAEPIDPDRPTILCIGESVMFGEGLMWDESVPAQIGSMTGIQTANLAVHGYSTDQGYLRLQTELPRFHHPVAVVSLFMPALFGRNLDDDRPHLGPGLVWRPPQTHARLLSLAKLLVPYRRDETVARGVAMTQEVLRASAELSRTRGATPLILVPQLGPEEAGEQAVRRRVLDDGALPYVLVQIDEAWRLPWDRHPNAYAAHVIAAAVVARLQKTIATSAAAGAISQAHHSSTHDSETDVQRVFH